MRAAVQTRYGPPDVVQVVEVDRPVPKPGELLVEVHVTTVNRTDCGFRAAKPFFVRLFSGLRRPDAPMLANEFAGVVAAVGDDVHGFQVGERVFGYDDARFGGHAEYLTIDARASVVPIPEGVSFEHAGAGTEGSHYALSAIRAAGVERAAAVLVYGATGAIGSAAVQLLKGMGAAATAVCATPHVELVRASAPTRWSTT